MKNIYFLGISLVLFMPLKAQSALSAVTAKEIVGSKPYIVLHDSVAHLTQLDDILGLSMPDSNGNEIIISPRQTGIINPPGGMVFNDVRLRASYVDDDGDIGEINGVTLTWRDSSGNIITDLSKKLTACSDKSYTLTVSANNVKAESIYGIPNSNSYGSTTDAIYSFNAPGGICYIRPSSLDLPVTYKAGSGLFPNFYNSIVFNPSKGFILEALNNLNVTFPQTGFKGAKFSLIGTGNTQIDYECKARQTTYPITLSGSATAEIGKNCTIEFNSVGRPNTEMIIDMYQASTGFKIDTYTIPNFANDSRRLWGEFITPFVLYGDPQAMVYGNGVFYAANMCAGLPSNTVMNSAQAGAYFFNRRQLTNSTDAIITSIQNNKPYSRDIDPLNPSFLAEWGVLNSTYYPGNSGFSLPAIHWGTWTAETDPNHIINFHPNQFTVTFSHGVVQATMGDGYLRGVFCKR